MNRINKLFIPVLLLGLSTIVVLELMALAVQAAEKDLQFVRGERDRIWYLKTDTLISTAPGTFSFWNKVVPAKGSPYFSRMGEVLHHGGKRTDRLEFIQALQEVDCTAGTSRILSIVYFDKKERIILTQYDANSSPALADFTGDAKLVAETVCAEAWSDSGEQYAVARFAPAPAPGK